jgi:hypothetical protein
MKPRGRHPKSRFHKKKISIEENHTIKKKKIIIMKCFEENGSWTKDKGWSGPS